jgi:hypothetical protein
VHVSLAGTKYKVVTRSRPAIESLIVTRATGTMQFNVLGSTCTTAIAPLPQTAGIIVLTSGHTALYNSTFPVPSNCTLDMGPETPRSPKYPAYSLTWNLGHTAAWGVNMAPQNDPTEKTTGTFKVTWAGKVAVNLP